MNGVKVLAIILLIAGALALIYKGFTYTRETHDAKIGPIELSVKDKERVTVPVWVGVALLAGGAGLLVFGARKSS